MNTEPFWMVWNPNGRAPTYRHDSEIGATTEATRLARTTPGQGFYVLAAVRLVEKNDVTVTEIAADGPF